MLIASKCESWYEICTNRYCYFCVSFSKDYVALRSLSLNKQSQLANNLQVQKANKEYVFRLICFQVNCWLAVVMIFESSNLCVCKAHWLYTCGVLTIFSSVLFRDILVWLAWLDPQENRVKRVTGVFLAHRDLLEPRVMQWVKHTCVFIQVSCNWRVHITVILLRDIKLL